ncbi:hypothetical protein MHYP_G00282420 [Metynnis hypsauchen]
MPNISSEQKALFEQSSRFTSGSFLKCAACGVPGNAESKSVCVCVVRESGDMWREYLSGWADNAFPIYPALLRVIAAPGSPADGSKSYISTAEESLFAAII